MFLSHTITRYITQYILSRLLFYCSKYAYIDLYITDRERENRVI
jgi:hypothetical protein